MKENHESATKIPPKFWASLILLLSAIESFFSIQHLFSLPSDVENALLLGLSVPRFVVFLFLAFAFIACLFTGIAITINQKIWHFVHSKISTHRKIIALSFGLAAIVLGWFTFLPAYRMGYYQAYFERLKPLISWIFLFSTQVVAYLWLTFQSHSHDKKNKRVSKNGLFSFLFFAGIFSLIIITICFTNWGISPIVRFWEKTGVPILSEQSYIAWVTGILLVLFLPSILSHTEKLPQLIKKYRWAIFIGIWIISAILWIREPIQFNHFNPGPYPPNQQHYPNSDAQYYDLSAQRALLGQDQYSIDKPLYSALLLAYHLLAGQDFNLMIQIQTALFAIFPALLFLLGTRLHHPYSGLLAALLANFRVINAIAAQMWIWKTSSPKLMMTEFPTAILLLLLTLTLIGWFSSKRNRLNYAIASGGILALATLMRHNNWAFLPMIIIFSLIALWNHKKIWVKTVLAFILFIFVSSAPMLVYNKIHTGQSFTFLSALYGSIINERIDPISQTGTVDNQEASSQESNQENENGETNNTQSTPYTINLDSDFDPGRIFKIGGTNSQPGSAVGKTDFIFINPVLDSMTRHFFHNLVSTGLSLPVSPSFDSLSYFLKESSFMQLWDIEWDGKLPIISWVMLVLNLCLVVIALAFSWQKWRWVGLTPFAIMMTYYAGNAVATTSGGRYLIPVDWAFYFYYGMGIILVLMFVADKIFTNNSSTVPEYNISEISSEQTTFQLKTGLPIAALFFAIVFLAALGLNGFQQKYPDYTTAEILQNLVLDQPNVDQSAMQLYVKAVQNGELMAIHGSLLYPQYLDYQQDEDYEVDTQNWENDYPSLIFTVLSNGRDFISGRLRMDSAPQVLPDGAEAIVFTCPDHDAYALLIFDEDQNILLQRTDSQDITCSK